MQKKEFISIFILVIMVFGIIHIAGDRNEEKILDTSYDTLANSALGVDSEPVELEPYEIIDNLRKEYQNNDIKGELRISNTTFKTPIPQSKNNDYYYRRLPNKSYSIIGSTYLDYRTMIDNSRVLIIYGHNSSKYNMPFKILENYYYKDYYDNHKYIELVTTNGIKTYEIFSVFVEINDFSYYTDIEFENNHQFLNHITKLKEKSFYDTAVSLNEDDNILILQACSTHKNYKKYKNKFVLVIAKEIEENEFNEEND